MNKYINIKSATNPRGTQWGGLLLDVTIEGIDGVKKFHAIPTDTEEHGRDLYQWAIDGEFGPVAPYVEPVPTKEEKLQLITDAVQAHLDAPAQALGYDTIITAALRAGYPGPYHAEGAAFAAWMDACWAACYAILAEVEAGTRPAPTIAELLAELPVLTLPS